MACVRLKTARLGEERREQGTVQKEIERGRGREGKHKIGMTMILSEKE